MCDESPVPRRRTARRARCIPSPPRAGADRARNRRAQQGCRGTRPRRDSVAWRPARAPSPGRDREAGGGAHPDRSDRRHALSRRHHPGGGPPPGPDHRDSLGGRRSHGARRRRRPVHRPHRAGGARRAHGLRAPPGDPARGARRSRTPRTPDPGRLCREEPAHAAFRGGAGAACRVGRFRRGRDPAGGEKRRRAVRRGDTEPDRARRARTNTPRRRFSTC